MEDKDKKSKVQPERGTVTCDAKERSRDIIFYSLVRCSTITYRCSYQRRSSYTKEAGNVLKHAQGVECMRRQWSGPEIKEQTSRHQKRPQNVYALLLKCSSD